MSSDVGWRRLRYYLTPQFDIYRSIANHLRTAWMVLDVGCYNGFGTLQLSKFGPSVFGMDTDRGAVEFASETLSRDRLVFFEGDITIPPNTFHWYDAVVMIEVLEHIRDWRSALENVRALLNPGGTFYISSRNANADLRRNDLHEREVTAAEFKAMLAGYFSEVKLYDYTLAAEQGDDSRVTPLVAVCVK